MSRCHIEKILTEQVVIDDGDMLLYRALPQHAQESLGPFVFLDHYQHQSMRGIGDKPHPHAGIEVFSYLLEGAMTHRDSMGMVDQLGQGDAQWMATGQGVVHAEIPTTMGRHGLQIWASLPPEFKKMPPRYASFRADQIPTKITQNHSLKVLGGQVNGMQGVIESVNAITMAYFEMSQQEPWLLNVDSTHELGIYVIEGTLWIDDQHLGRGQLAQLSQGCQVQISALDKCKALLLGGYPIDYPLFFNGPFVMDSEAALQQAYADYRAGKMGRL